MPPLTGFRYSNQAKQKAELLPGTLEMMILKALDRNSVPMHGYGTPQYTKQVSEDVLHVEEDSLYPALQRVALKARLRRNGSIRKQPPRLLL